MATPFELSMLSDIHKDFNGFGLSAIDISSHVLVGRPYGGTAILYRKQLIAQEITISPNDESRITAVTVSFTLGPVLFANVYMPTAILKGL